MNSFFLNIGQTDLQRNREIKHLIYSETVKVVSYEGGGSSATPAMRNVHNTSFTAEGEKIEDNSCVIQEILIEYYHASHGKNGFFIRQIEDQDAYLKKSKREFNSTMKLVGRFGDTWFRVDQGLIFEEGNEQTKSPIKSSANFMLSRFESCLNLGLDYVADGSLNIEDGRLSYFMEFDSMDGECTRRNRKGRIQREGKQVTSIVLDNGFSRIDYEYNREEFNKINIPSRIFYTVTGEHGKELNLINYETAEKEMPPEFFKPEKFLDMENHFYATYLDGEKYTLNNPAQWKVYIDLQKANGCL